MFVATVNLPTKSASKNAIINKNMYLLQGQNIFLKKMELDLDYDFIDFNFYIFENKKWKIKEVIKNRHTFAKKLISKNLQFIDGCMWNKAWLKNIYKVEI